MEKPPPLPGTRFLSAVGTTLIVLGILAAFFFPTASRAGTETTTTRWILAIAFVVAGLVLHASGGRKLVVAGAALILVGAASIASAAWPIVLAAAIAAAPYVIAFAHHVRGRRDETRSASPGTDGESTSDIIESIATAFILALIVREFAFEAFKIPTGSMYPTIMGDDMGSNRKGDRLLAAKAPLLFAEPKRWSIMVFKYPLFRPTNYIKRLVGMPGELLQIRKGDIYVNGKVISRPEEVQETLWCSVFPTPGPSYAGGSSREFVGDGVGKWSFETPDTMTGTVETGKTGWAMFDAACPDLRVSFELDSSLVPQAGAALVRLDGDGRRIDVEFGRDGVWLTAPGTERQKLDMAGLSGGSEKIGVGVADRVVRVWRGGRLAARIETADVTNLDSSRANQVWLGVNGAAARFANVRVEQDLQYGTEYAPNEWKIPEGSYFMLGDNTHQSKDSRAWRGNIFRTKDGRSFVADNQIRLDDERPVTNIHPLGDAYEFFDSYGVKQHLAKADLVDGTYRAEAQPFVRREDLVGRAFMIFFPFPPFGEFRPRLLP